MPSVLYSQTSLPFASTTETPVSHSRSVYCRSASSPQSSVRLSSSCIAVVPRTSALATAVSLYCT